MIYLLGLLAAATPIILNAAILLLIAQRTTPAR
jgi:hypothetical protein